MNFYKVTNEDYYYPLYLFLQLHNVAATSETDITRCIVLLKYVSSTTGENSNPLMKHPKKNIELLCTDANFI